MAAAAVAGLAWVAFFSSALDVRVIQVAGAPHVDARAVEDVAGVRGDNLLTLSTSQVVERIETLPWVKSARVERRLPSTLRVRIEERHPAMVLAVGAARWTLDSHGRVLEPGVAADGLPVLGGLEVGDIAPGGSLDTPEARDALKTWRALPAGLKGRVVAIFAPTPERLTLSMVAGTLVRYGAAEALEAKNEVLRSLLADLAAEGRAASYIDVRVPTNPAVSALPPGALGQPAVTPSAAVASDGASTDGSAEESTATPASGD
jgi:cell division protein FtsQ